MKLKSKHIFLFRFQIKMNAHLVRLVSILVQMFLVVIPVAVSHVIQKLELNVSCDNARLVVAVIDTVM